MVLVVGATGQLGTAVVRKLVMAGKPVRAFVRNGSRYQHLQGEGVELAFGDLRDPASIAAACQGVDAVIATANAVLPENSGSFAEIEDKGYQDLITSSQEAKVKQFIYISVPVTPHDKTVPNFRYKRLNEKRLQNSSLNYTIFRSSLFMDSWFAFIGSTIPGRGAEAATIQRQYWFLKLFMKGVGNLIEGPGIALIPGNSEIRHAFIAVDDVASYLVNAIEHPEAERAIFHIGGPEILSWKQVVDIYSQALGRQLRAIYVPGAVFRAQRALISPFSEAASDIMGLNWLVCYETVYDSEDVATTFRVQLTHAQEFLHSKVSLPQSQQ